MGQGARRWGGRGGRVDVVVVFEVVDGVKVVVLVVGVVILLLTATLTILA